MQRQITVGVVAHEDPYTSRKEWSGTCFNVRAALEGAGFATKWIYYGKPHWPWYRMCVSVALRHGVKGKMGLLPGYGRMCARTVDRRVVDECDAVIFVGRGEMAQHLRLECPTLYLTDATLHQMADYYYKGMSDWWRRQTDRVNADTFAAVDHVVSASQWATASMLTHYGVAADKITTVPFGANLEPELIRPSQAQPWQEGGRLEVLYSGLDWERKGGTVAMATVAELRRRGIDARLTVAGPRERPEECRDDIPWLDYKGFLYKKDPAQLAEYLRIIDRSHVFLLPTQAECAGIVFCECAGYGIPSFTYDTGGVADYVIDGVTGRRLSPGSGAAGFADAIEAALPRLSELRANALDYYRTTLNWDNWGRRVGAVIRRLVAERPRR